MTLVFQWILLWRKHWNNIMYSHNNGGSQDNYWINFNQCSYDYLYIHTILVECEKFMICQKILCFMLQTLTPLYYFSQKNLNKLKIDSENMHFTYFFSMQGHCLRDFFFLPESNSFTSVPYTWEVEFYWFSMYRVINLRMP